MAYIPLAQVEAKVTAIKGVTDVIPNSGSMTSIAQDATVAKPGNAMTLTAAYDAAKTATQTSDLNVPAQNTANNSTERDVVGNKTDDEAGNSLYAKAYISGRHFHSPAKVYPTLANATVISKVNANAWGLDANPTEIIPAATIANPFDIHNINLGNISNNDEYEMLLFSGGVGVELEIARVSFDRSATVTEGAVACQTELQPAGTRISAKLTSAAAAARSCNVKLHYHEY